MKIFRIKKGLDIPIDGAPSQMIQNGPTITRIGLLGQDYHDLRPALAVGEGDRVKKGQLLFTDKKNPGVHFTAPASGTVQAINRGAKRKFESLVITLDETEPLTFPSLDGRAPQSLKPDEIRNTLIQAGLWRCFRTRPFGKVPKIDSLPASLFVTAIDTQPLAPDPLTIIDSFLHSFRTGLVLLAQLIENRTVHLCFGSGGGDRFSDITDLESVRVSEFHGPHPAGLSSTHIHFLDPVSAGKTVWQIGYQDVIAIGKLFEDGELFSDRIISLAGPGIKTPCLMKTVQGADIGELCRGKLHGGKLRIVSGSVLNGHHAEGRLGYLGHYDQQVTGLPEGSGRGFFSWLSFGLNRFSMLPLFVSSFLGKRTYPMNTAEWGGQRAIFPVGTYEAVMPLDLVITTLLKTLAVGDTSKSQQLGCLELIEEDLALCSFACPGKNNFGPMLRDILTRIEAGE